MPPLPEKDPRATACICRIPLSVRWIPDPEADPANAIEVDAEIAVRTYHFVVANRVYTGISPSGFDRDGAGLWSGNAAYEGMIFEADDYGQYPHGLAWDYDNDYGVKPCDHILKAIVSELGMDRSSTKRSQMC